MDLHLKQWRNQDESDHLQQLQPSGKIPKLVQLDHYQPLQHHQPLHLYPPNDIPALPFFVPDQPNLTKFSNLSPLPDSPTPCKLPRMGSSYFSLAQWQELELQALIYRYMLAGAAVPQELLQPIKKSLHIQSSPYFLRHPLQHYSFYQPALLQTGYWGRAAMDPEPGRCRRTDGKKWRCSRDVVAGQKYCERHVHRGRNRSRKPVETPTSTSTTAISTTDIPFGTGGGALGGVALGGVAASGGVSAFNITSASLAAPPLAVVGDGDNSFSLSGQSPSIDLLHLSHSSLEDSKIENKSLLGGPRQNEGATRSDGHILRPFFDDWPRSVQKPDNQPGANASTPINSSTCLTISMPGNPSSDVSLKLATGNTGDEPGPRGGNGREQPQVSWGSGWTSGAQVASMGGPLAEALRSSSSTSNSSPTSVFPQLHRGSGSEASYVSSS